MDVLTRIFAAKREELEYNRASVPLADLKSIVASTPAPLPFHAALLGSVHNPSLIAEVKKASPVKGVIRADFDPAMIARAYREAGADCLSVLTDIRFFQGDPAYLALCKLESELPVLRKDFTVDEYDVWQSRALEADAILLIVAGLDASQLLDYRELAENLGMAVIVEAHSLQEAELALETGAKLVGINNRDLTTFETNLEATERTVPAIARRATVVSESALATHEDVQRVARAGARAVLIGTTFCAASDIGAKVREVMGW